MMSDPSVSNLQRRRVIRASEIGQYAYCARAWWLGSVVGVPSANTVELQRGATMHQQHGRAVWFSRALVIGAVVLAGLALIVLIVSFTGR